MDEWLNKKKHLLMPNTKKKKTTYPPSYQILDETDTDIPLSFPILLTSSGFSLMTLPSFH